MATILDLITVGEKLIYQVDAAPGAGGGTPATIGSFAMLETVGSVGQMWLKVGPLDTDWDLVVTLNAQDMVADGLVRRLAIYDGDHDTHLDDTVELNSFSVDVRIEDQPTRTVAITYQIPNPGDDIAAADFVLTEGDQSISGDKTFEDNVVINGNLTVNGLLTYINTVNTEITDHLITLNKGGAAASAVDSGLEFEEDNVMTAWFKTSADREEFRLKAPAIANETSLSLELLTADREHRFADVDGTFVMQPSPITGVANQITWWYDTYTVTADTGVAPNALTWDDTNNFFGVQTASPQSIIHVGNFATAGTVGANAILLGQMDAAANIGSGAFLTNGIGGANQAVGADSAVFGRGNRANGLVSFAAGLGSYADADYSFALGRRSKINSMSGSFVLSDSQDIDNTSDMANNLRMRFQNGLDLWRGDGDSPSYKLRQFLVTTTDATLTTLATIAIPTNKTMLIEARVLARRTGGVSGNAGDSMTYIRTVKAKNVGGTVTILKLQSDYTSEDQLGTNAVMSASGTDVLLQVKGAANNDFLWHATVIEQIV